jgi:hypothetical protein
LLPPSISKNLWFHSTIWNQNAIVIQRTKHHTLTFTILKNNNKESQVHNTLESEEGKNQFTWSCWPH